MDNRKKICTDFSQAIRIDLVETKKNDKVNRELKTLEMARRFFLYQEETHI